MFPKVTLSREEFWNNEKPECEYFYRSLEDYFDTRGKGANGLCGHRTIWLRTLDPITLLHELIHYPIIRIHLKAMWFKTASVVLFLDFLHSLHDFINGVLRRKDWRLHIHESFLCVRNEFKDWIDWIRCRDP